MKKNDKFQTIKQFIISITETYVFDSDL